MARSRQNNLSKKDKGKITKSKAETKNKGKGNIKAAVNMTGERNRDYMFSMSYAGRIDEGTNILQLIPVIFFGAFVIFITRLHSYERNMSQFYWSSDSNSLTDFFSYYKMTAILTCAAVTLLLILYRIFKKTLAIKKSFVYIPMAVYFVMVLISYLLSEYKEFSFLGYNDRFEGTIVLLAYMVMLFYVINSINNEYNLKCILYPIAASSALLGAIGVSQSVGHDFFQTAVGQKLITPNITVPMTSEFLSGNFGQALLEAGLITEGSYTINQLIDMGASIGEPFLKFKFQNNEIYQTVFNINYVSFYLTLIIPLFGMLFIQSVMRGKEEPLYKKVIFGALFALLVYNLIGSASSGGWLGMAVVAAVALIVLNKKIWSWRKPVIMLLILAVITGGITFDKWIDELKGTATETLKIEQQQNADEDADATSVEFPRLHYIDTEGADVIIGLGDNTLTITTDAAQPKQVIVKDQEGKPVNLIPTKNEDVYSFDDERFSTCFLQYVQDEKGNNYFFFTGDAQKTRWAFKITDDGVFYLNIIGKLVDLDKIPAIGWEDNQRFGSGRGYIFSRTLPMMKDTVLIGHGADTYAIYFPQKDYVGKYNSDYFSNDINIVVDKAHNMYMGMWIGTGGISAIALFALFLIYIVQSAVLYMRNRFDKDDFSTFAGAGIFFGICGFLVVALFNDSSVSVMPLFYTLLGTGIAINMMLARKVQAKQE